VKHLLFLAVILLGLLPVRALEPFVDGVAAAVNDEIVTFSQVQELTGLRSTWSGKTEPRRFKKCGCGR